MAATTRTFTRVRSLAPHHAETSVLQHPEQVSLPFGGKVADFIQEKSAAVGHLKAPRPAADRAGEGAFDVAKQFG